MAIEIPSSLVEFILLGPADDRRQLQDSPILGDVWIAFGKAPAKPHELLISPYKTRPAGHVAATIAKALSDDSDDARIAYLQGLVVADLKFRDVLRVIVPKTAWWIDRWEPQPAPAAPKKGRGKSAVQAADGASSAPGVELVMPTGETRRFVHEVTERYFGSDEKTHFPAIMKKIILSAKPWNAKSGERVKLDIIPLDRFAALTGLILWAGQEANEPPPDTSDVKKVIDHILTKLDEEKPDEKLKSVSDLLAILCTEMLADQEWQEVKKGGVPLVWSVSCNRFALPAIAKSVPAVKADAATTLFKVNCSEIAWAVLDSGIDSNHPAFARADGTGSRVVKTFDFKDFRRIVSLSNTNAKRRADNVKRLMIDRRDSLKNPFEDEKAADAALLQLAEDAEKRGLIHWELVERFVELKCGIEPETNHGTHVAGIIGANAKAARKIVGKQENDTSVNFFDGMCPDILLYDFRVLGPKLEDTEFAIIAALQFIRHLNDRDSFLSIHGANLSLSIPHDVRNFACGRTPICDECERMVNGGVVVVTAAGNHGYKSFETKEGAYESYAAFSITDPGNADGVITVGATHRYWPHTYGVSFFSSRGPTGDGRLKPDLVAPGERIRAPFPGKHELGGEWGELDGTSMAAPHVSGAAAMLLARYSELIGRPREVKRILCDTATDLGRERSFQGRGMLDVLRAFQSI
jgi:hypothetical protein